MNNSFVPTCYRPVTDWYESHTFILSYRPTYPLGRYEGYERVNKSAQARVVKKWSVRK